MLSFLKRKLVKCQKGAMDKILVTLLLVIVGVGAVVGLKNWMDTQKTSMQTAAENSISAAQK